MSELTEKIVAGFDIDGYAEEHDADLLKADGFDDCAVGIVSRCSQPDIVCYSAEKIVLKLMADGMDRDAAEEFFAYNILDAWVGDLTPCFLEIPE